MNGRARWVPLIALAVVPVMLFGSIFVGLRLPPRGHPDAALGFGSLDLSRGPANGLSPLREPFIADVLGETIGAPAGTPAPSGALTLGSSDPSVAARPVVVSHPLTNDDFARAYRVKSVPFTARTNTEQARRESDEPSGCAPVGDKTVWYRFRAPTTVGLIADTFGTDHAVTLGVFAGKDMPELEQIGCEAHARGNAHVPFPAVEGTTYYFQVASVSGGDLVFDLRLQGLTTRFVAGDQFVAAVGGPTHDDRFWGFIAIEAGAVGASDTACAGVITLAPAVPKACRIQTYVLDRRTEQTALVSVGPDGTPGNDQSLGAVVSAGGRYVAFTSWATNLVDDDRNTCYLYDIPGQCPDTFVHDRDADADGIFDETHAGARRTIRISVSSDGEEGNDWSALSLMSQDGRYVGFQSEADTLVEGDTNGVGDAFVHDRDADGDGIFDETDPGASRTLRVSVSSAGEQAKDRSVVADPQSSAERRDFFPLEHGNHLLGLSRNGRYALFRSPAPDLVEGDTNGVYDVFLRDIGAGTTTRVNVSSDEVEADKGTRLHNTFWGPVSDDGRYAIFVSDATNLVPDDSNDGEDLFLRDIVEGTTERLTVSWEGNEVTEPPAPGQDVVFGGATTAVAAAGYRTIFTLSELNHAMTPDGRYVFFSSGAQLVPEDQDEQRDIYVRDLLHGTITLVSVATSGEKGNASSNLPIPSADGRMVAFISSATNLDEGDQVIDIPVYATYVRFLPGGP